jgi:hypothetical protein
LCTGERKNTWIARSIKLESGFGVFTKGSVIKDELLAMYRGELKIYKFGEKIPYNLDSVYIISYTDTDGTTYVIDGKDAELKYGTIGHKLNSSVMLDESKLPARITWNADKEAFAIYANFAWDSGASVCSIFIRFFNNEILYR